ncbi:MAG: response regulator [Desulfobacteraceae bacterium]|nr:response regulator [Desulfobacteraceae bacterium]
MTKEKESFILIVDDNPANLQLLGHILRENKYKTAIAKDGSKALSFINKKIPDLILMDAMIPETGGFEVCRLLKACDAGKDIPVIFLSPHTDSFEKIKCFEAGGSDYITKPFQKEEIIAKVKTHLELKLSQEKLKSVYQSLKKISEELESSARTDSLTNLPNHHDILDKIEYERARSQRSGRPFSLVLAKIDDLNILSNKYGNECRDFVIVSAGRMMRARLRKQDVVARWKDDEFLLLLPETDVEGGKIVAGIIGQIFSENSLEYDNHKLEVSMTFDVSSFSKFDDIDK